jgi:hypothetical protein
MVVRSQDQQRSCIGSGYRRTPAMGNMVQRR